jgi:uncharacterized protein YndB with AHSA1/START domain
MATTKGEKDWTGHEFLIVREFAAPRELVFRAWTDPKHLKEWWGPGGFTNPVCEWDARPGGKIYDVMRAPNGQDYPMGGEFREVIAPEKVSFVCVPLNEKGEMIFELLHTAVFTGKNGKTKMTLRSQVLRATPEANRYISGFEAGMGSSLERLTEFLAWPFVITHEFAAPREMVWKAWTERDQLMKWFGPKGSTVVAANMDFRVGGVLHYCMRVSPGMELWGKATYREILPPEKIVWVQCFSDKDGGVTPNPFNKGPWPLYMLTQVSLAENGGKTLLTLKAAPFEATDEETGTFRAAIGGMTQGWTGALQRLTDYLATK